MLISHDTAHCITHKGNPMSQMKNVNLHEVIPDAPVIFFDLDDTLLDKDTNSLWLRWRITECKKGYLELAIGLHNFFYYKKGKLTEERKAYREKNERVLLGAHDQHKP
jgi:hypothetical protein